MMRRTDINNCVNVDVVKRCKKKQCVPTVSAQQCININQHVCHLEGDMVLPNSCWKDDQD